MHHSEMFQMLRNMEPPLGFGNKCPNRLAYKKLIRMNMPLDDEGKVDFSTTLFALIRENLEIKMRPREYIQTPYQLWNYIGFYLQRNTWIKQIRNFAISSEKCGLSEPLKLNSMFHIKKVSLYKLNRRKAVEHFLLLGLNGMRLTVGKIYGGLMILDTWRTSRFGKIQTNAAGVSRIEFFCNLLNTLDICETTWTKTNSPWLSSFL